MTQHKPSQYQAYSLATRTVAKTRQVVMLYDGAIRFIKQAQEAVREKRIEDRFKLLLKASEIMKGLHGSIDFEKGGEVAMTLHHFYMNMSVRILSVNFHREEGDALCSGIVGELKQMRDVWDNIDQTLSAQGSASGTAAVSTPQAPTAAGGVSLSA